jgi:hypothetical protein
VVKRSEQGAGGQRFLIISLLLVVVALGGVVFYLLSDIQQRKFQLRQDGQTLLIERGRFMPVGFEIYQPKLKSLKSVYVPLNLPDGFNFGLPRVFNDRIELDFELFSLLSGWFRTTLETPEKRNFDNLEILMERMSALPSLAGEQRLELVRLKADYAYWEGRTIVEGIVDELERAKKAFTKAIDAGSTYSQDAQNRLKRLESRLEGELSKEQEPASQKPEGDLELPQAQSFVKNNEESVGEESGAQEEKIDVDVKKVDVEEIAK